MAVNSPANDVQFLFAGFGIVTILTFQNRVCHIVNSWLKVVIIHVKYVVCLTR